MENFQKFLDPETLARIKDLELRAKRLIEGLVSGAHRSPFQGLSVEFAEHREYTPGDDVRHVDWKVFAKTEKVYLKRYEQETNLVCNIVLDTSESMSYTSGGDTKLSYASRIAAALAYLVLHQQDSVGLTMFEDRVKYLVQPSGQAAHLKQILHLLAACQPTAEKSKVGQVLNDLADRFRKRSLVIVLSDCFDDVDAIIAGLRHLRYKRHEVAIFQIVDPAEVEFEFKGTTLFKGLENMPELLVDPRGLKAAYKQEFGNFLKSMLAACRSSNVEYHLVRTDEPLDRVLSNYLSGRARKSA